MKNKVLVTRNLLQENEERVKKLFDVKLNKEEKIYTIDEVIELSKDCDGILSFLTDKLDSAAIDKLSNKVKIIANYAVGYGNIDINAAAKKGIVVTNTPEVLTDATADITILLLLGASRRAYEGRKLAEQQNWTWKPDFISTGNIGCITQISSGTKIPILHTIEILNWYTGGEKPNAINL